MWIRAFHISVLFFLGLSPVRGLGQELCPPPDKGSGHSAVVGRVLDGETEVPLGFVQIRLAALDGSVVRETRSRPNGEFSFCDFPAGVAELTGQMGQLGGRIGPLTLAAGEVVPLALPLLPPTEEGNSGTITGIVLDFSSGEPVEGATVLAPDLGQTEITNGFGRFTFPSLPPGEVEIRVSRLGYATVTGTVTVVFNRTVHTEIRMATEPIQMEPIEVVGVRQRIVLPGLEHLERRLHAGWGEFVLEDEIQRRMPSRLSDVLYEAGVDTGNNGHSLTIRRTGCAPMVYIDGVRVTHQSRLRGVLSQLSSTGAPRPLRVRPPRPGEGPAGEAADAVNNLVHPMDVIAVEVYRGPAEIPGEYLDSNAQCGVILIWTRRGNFRPDSIGFFR